mgnify:CR=1 FL=1|tara:strand:+ start:725 stop:1270 length:546 start_codon:yes stop_codon:yes gene_type:complete
MWGLNNMINGKKTTLQSVKEHNIEQLRNWRNNPDLRKYFREYREISRPMQAAWFNKINNDNNQVNFEIHDKESDKIIGHCGLYYISWVHRHAEFGIYIGDFNFRNGGYGSDALRTLVKYGFEDLNLNKIWCEVYTNNSALGVYERLGFVREGTLRQSYFNEGKYWDSNVLSLLRSEYEQQK